MIDEVKRKNNLIRATYNKLGLGLLVTGIIALIVSILFGDLLLSLYTSFISYLIVNIIIIAIMMFLIHGMTNRIHERDFKGLRNSYYIVAILFGFTMSSIFLIYSIKIIVSAFVITGVLLFLLSKIMVKDTAKLNKWYRVTSIGLLALIVATVVGALLGNTGFNLIISIVGVAIFAVFIVLDTNRIISKSRNIAVDDVELLSYMYALDLYLDVINFFQYILRIINILDGSDNR